MKSNIKNGLLYIGVFYMIVVVIMMFITYNKAVTDIELSSSSEEYKEKINGYKEQVANLSDSSCKNYMKSLIGRVENDILNDEISIKEYYKLINSDENLLTYYSKASEECSSITNEIMHDADMPIKFLTPSILADEIVQDYIYQYELGFEDYKTRAINSPYLVVVENNIRVQNELQIIEKLLSIIDWEKEV